MYRKPYRRSGRAMAIAVLVLGMAMCSLSHANLPPPAVVWWSAPVMPGEIVLLPGGDWGDDHWINGGIMVLAGRGAGQLRRCGRAAGPSPPGTSSISTTRSSKGMPTAAP